mgnify:CR=1 FL=1
MRKVVKVNGRNIFVYRKGHENKHLGRAFVKYWKEGKVALPPNGKHRLQEDRHGKKRVFANSALDRRKLPHKKLGLQRSIHRKNYVEIRNALKELLPHREPMLLIDKLINIVPLKSATAIMHVKKEGFYVQGHFPGQPVMPGVLIVEAFGQAAAALTAHGIDPKEYENKLVFLMSVDKARFRNPVIPDCELRLEIEAVRSHGRVWKYKGTAKVEGKRMADAEWSATIVDRK